MRAAGALVCMLAAACGIEVGAPGVWVAATDVDGAELGAPPSMRKPAAIDRTIRVVTYNVHLGADPARLAAEIRGNEALASADLFLLQEEEWHPAEGTTRARRLAEALGTGWVYLPGRPEGEGTHGLAMLSRFPIEDAAMMTLPTTDGWRPRIAMRAHVVVGDVRLVVVNVHLETRINVTDRILQIRPAVIDLPDAAIVAGDVNTNPFLWEGGVVPVAPTASVVDTDQAPVLDDYMRALGFATPAADVGPTHSTLGIESRLDAIYTRGHTTTPARVERSLTSSDHWPVWIDVTLP